MSKKNGRIPSFHEIHDKAIIALVYSWGIWHLFTTLFGR